MSWEDRYSIKYRQAERQAICRGCDKELNKGDMMIATYSFRNRGQHIYFCRDCVKLMNNLIDNSDINGKY